MPSPAAPESSKSAAQIFAEMYRDLRAWNRDIPESPDRLDPVLRMLLTMYAQQLAELHERIDSTWEAARDALIRSLDPTAKRWPVPAVTVMSCDPADHAVEIDPHTRFFHKEKREGGRVFLFSSYRTVKLLSARVRHMWLRTGDRVLDLSPDGGDAEQEAQGSRAPIRGVHRERLYMAIEYEGDLGDFRGSTLFLRAAPEALHQLRWALWCPCTGDGNFQKSSGFCPGRDSGIEELVEHEHHRPRDWGGLRTGHELYGDLEDHWVRFPSSFLAAWKKGPPESALIDLAMQSHQELAEALQDLFWIRLDLPRTGNRVALRSAIDGRFNCFMAANKDERTVFKHTGNNTLVDVELPVPLRDVLDIANVTDTDGREYRAREDTHTEAARYAYALEQRRDRLVLRFDFSDSASAPPDSLKVSYLVTDGVAANGIAEGSITDLYENHPGVLAARNVLPVLGAIPAKTDHQLATEASLRLRYRDRALTYPAIVDWSTTFDDRIRSVACEDGVERGDQGMRRCIIVRVAVKASDFCSLEERSLLGRRLERFLKARSAVNTHYRIEVRAE